MALEWSHGPIATWRPVGLSEDRPGNFGLCGIVAILVATCS